MKKIISFFLLTGFSVMAQAWDGTSTQSGAPVEIGKGNKVRSGEEIEVYDYGTGTYKQVEVQSVEGNGSGADVEVYDYETGEYDTLEME